MCCAGCRQPDRPAALEQSSIGAELPPRSPHRRCKRSQTPRRTSLTLPVAASLRWLLAAGVRSSRAAASRLYRPGSCSPARMPACPPTEALGVPPDRPCVPLHVPLPLPLLLQLPPQLTRLALQPASGLGLVREGSRGEACARHNRARPHCICRSPARAPRRAAPMPPGAQPLNPKTVHRPLTILWSDCASRCIGTRCAHSFHTVSEGRPLSPRPGAPFAATPSNPKPASPIAGSPCGLRDPAVSSRAQGAHPPGPARLGGCQRAWGACQQSS